MFGVLLLSFVSSLFIFSFKMVSGSFFECFLIVFFFCLCLILDFLCVYRSLFLLVVGCTVELTILFFVFVLILIIFCLFLIARHWHLASDKVIPYPAISSTSLWRKLSARLA